VLSQADLPHGYRFVVGTPAELIIQDWNKPQLMIRATLEEDGELWFYVQAEVEEPTLPKRGFVRGRVLFDLMLLHFGNEVNAIIGFWTRGPNYVEFHKRLAEGYSEAEAALATWTGKNADRACFGDVRTINMSKSTDTRPWVKIEFHRTGENDVAR